MDYLDAVVLTRHVSWHEFEAWRRGERRRLVLFTTAATSSYLDYRFDTADVLLFGRESAGVPPEVHAAADARLVISMRPGSRSLNVALAAAMAAGEALRQSGRT
jgi:tRNA (cytidine/uridine-2'-O-)-methyltransferase